MSEKSAIIFDIEGGELGVDEMLKGAVFAANELRKAEFDLLLVTTEPAKVKDKLDSLIDGAGSRFGCEMQVIEAKDRMPKKFSSPVEAYKEFPESTIRVAMNCAKEHPHSAVISPGSTGLVMTAGMFTLGRIKGIERVPIGTPMPTRGKELFFVDGGSNVDCRALHLHQFALLAHLYLETIRGVERPQIALLSNGSEGYKGNTVVREAAKLIEQDPHLNFTGFIEGHTVFSGGIDIMVCDGFLGNIFLKSAEGIVELIGNLLKEELRRNWFTALTAKLLLGGAFRRFAARMDYGEFGGAPLLGLKGNVIISHGRSNAKAIKNAIIVGYKLASRDFGNLVAKFFQDNPAALANGNGAGKPK